MYVYQAEYECNTMDNKKKHVDIEKSRNFQNLQYTTLNFPFITEIYRHFRWQFRRNLQRPLVKWSVTEKKI